MADPEKNLKGPVLEASGPSEGEVPGATTTPKDPEPPYSSFPKWKRVVMVYVASLAAFSSPVASTTYYPAMSQLANDLDVSLTKISLTITTFMVHVP
jgi:hypothetical protein